MRDVHVGRSSQSAHRSAVAGHQIGTADATPCARTAWTPTASPCWWRCYTGMATSIFWRTICYISTIAGGQAREPGCDLAIVGARWRAPAKSKAISRTTCAIGEISLTGQVRPVPRLEYRLARGGPSWLHHRRCADAAQRTSPCREWAMVQVGHVAGRAWPRCQR